MWLMSKVLYNLVSHAYIVRSYTSQIDITEYSITNTPQTLPTKKEYFKVVLNDECIDRDNLTKIEVAQKRSNMIGHRCPVHFWLEDLTEVADICENKHKGSNKQTNDTD